MLGQRCNVNHCSAVLETQQISLEHTSRIIPILVRVISIEEGVPETLLFGMPSFKVKLHTRLSFLPLAPCNARCDGFTCIRHGSPPLLDCESGLCCRPPTRFSLMNRKIDTRRFSLQPLGFCFNIVVDILLIPTSCGCAVNRLGVPGRARPGNLLVGWPYRNEGYYLHRILSLAIQYLAAHGGWPLSFATVPPLRHLPSYPPE